METRDSANRRGYNYKWQRIRIAFLKLHPLCVMCLKEGITTKGTVVDHVIPHKGDKKLFWDKGNWQTLCKRHHDSDKQKEERKWVKEDHNQHQQQS